MKRIVNVLAFSLMLALIFITSGCKSKSEELTYDDFKKAYNDRKIINYNSCKINGFYGFMDESSYREEDGTPILSDVVIEKKEGKWVNEEGKKQSIYDVGYELTRTVYDGEYESNEPYMYILDDIYVDYISNWEVSNLKFNKKDDNYIIKYSDRTNDYDIVTHIHNRNNRVEYNYEVTMTFNEYFCLIDYKEVSKDLIPNRVHDNLILREEHISWSINEKIM
ncbi:MAG: hypothetical protein K5892_02295 [Acholeplasmatales bacterium]|nr:hypothetical protein [Acholeplasmatales bacterium]